MVITALIPFCTICAAPWFAREEASRTDGELLECFIARRDEWVFLALMRRHGPMVLGVCQASSGMKPMRRTPSRPHFSVLVRKAGSIRPAGRVGNWLYGLAHTTALKARAMNSKRLAKEHEAAAPALPRSPRRPGNKVQGLCTRS